MNFSKVKIRASSIGDIMTAPREKKEELSETCKNKLIDIYSEITTGRKKEISNCYIEKGLNVEGDSIALYNRLREVECVKNELRFENEWVTGTPDLINERRNGTKKVIDIKSKWDVHTFNIAILKGVSNLYYWQLQSYMWLTGADSAELANCLVNTPLKLIRNAQSSLMWKMGTDSDDPLFIEACQAIEYNMTYYDMPKESRIFIENVPRCQEDIDKIAGKVEKCRKWLQDFHVMRQRNKNNWEDFNKHALITN